MKTIRAPSIASQLPIVGLLAVLFFQSLETSAAEPGKIRVACVGDSTTQGAGVENRAKESYPAQLQAMLGDGYVVENHGVGSCTLIRQGSPNVWRTLKRVYGGDPKFERPKVLCVDGRPAWLYAPSGWNVTGGQRTVSHVLKINLQTGEGPLTGLK